MGQLGVVLYEFLGEEFPEVLGSIIGALKAIVNVIGMNMMTPPIKGTVKLWRFATNTYRRPLAPSYTHPSEPARKGTGAVR